MPASFASMQFESDSRQNGNPHRFTQVEKCSNRVFDDYDAIIDAACEAWRTLVALPEEIKSIGLREWCHVDRCL
jgi:hypothetical protein